METNEQDPAYVRGWRCPHCDALIRAKGSTEKPAVRYRRPRGGGKPIGFCLACGKPAHTVKP